MYILFRIFFLIFVRLKSDFSILVIFISFLNSLYKTNLQVFIYVLCLYILTNIRVICSLKVR